MATIQQSHRRKSGDATWLTPDEMRVLEAVCDTLIPSLAPPEGEDDPHGFYARKAGDLNVAQAIAETLALESPEIEGRFQATAGSVQRPRLRPADSRTPAQLHEDGSWRSARKRSSICPIARWRSCARASRPSSGSPSSSSTARPTAERINPNWPALDYTPAPPPPSPEAAPKRIRTLEIRGDETLTADAVIVGSGAGGGMMAAELAAAGKDVLVIEKGGYYNEADFSGLEAEMTPQLFLRRGALSTADLGMVVLAGSTLGGGTIVNWSTSLRTPPEVLEEWERQHGVDGATSARLSQGFRGGRAAAGHLRPTTARPIATTRLCATAARSWATSGSRSRATPLAASSAVAPVATAARSDASSPRC